MDKRTELTVRGRTRTVEEWARWRGMTIETLVWRLEHGWEAPDAVLVPVRPAAASVVVTAFGRTLTPGERRARRSHRQAHQARLDAGGRGIPARAVEADGKDRHRGRRDARRPRMVRTHRHSGRRHLLKAVHRLDPGARRRHAGKEKAQDGTSGVVIGGERLTVREWAERTGIPANVISNRLNRGWTPERAVGTPVRPRRRRDA